VESLFLVIKFLSAFISGEIPEVCIPQFQKMTCSLSDIEIDLIQEQGSILCKGSKREPVERSKAVRRDI
jgi:hypothetical protein